MLLVSSSALPQFNSLASTTLKAFYKPFNACVNWIKVYRNDRRLQAIAETYNQHLIRMEMTPIKECEVDGMLSKLKKLTGEMESSKRERVKNALFTLNRHIIALECRTKKTQIPDESYYDQIATYAQKWKKGKLYFINKNLTERDIKKLKEACHYQGFAQILLSDPQCRDEFFRWTILNDSRVCPFQPNDVAVFVKFPGLHKEILDRLGYRSARFGGTLFQVDEEDQLLTLLLEGKRVKVIHNASMEAKGHQGIGKMTVTFQDIFRELNHKISYDGDGEFEITDNGGVWLWNAKRLAYYHEGSKSHIRIDLEGDDWINRLPTQETLTYEEAKNRYQVEMEVKPDGFEGDFTSLKYRGLDSDTHPLFNLAATEKDKYDFLGTHGYNVFLLVNRKLKTVEVKSLGQFLYPFPLGPWSLFNTLTKFSPSYMYSPDENTYNGNRKHAGDYSVPPVIVRTNPLEWFKYTQSLKTDIIHGWNDKLGFNFVVLQCMTRVWKKARKHFGVGRIPDLRVRYWKLHPKGAVGAFYNTLKSLSERVTLFVFLFMGSWRGMTIVNKYGEEETIRLCFYKRPFKYAAHPAGLFESVDPDIALEVS